MPVPDPLIFACGTPDVPRGLYAGPPPHWPHVAAGKPLVVAVAPATFAGHSADEHWMILTRALDALQSLGLPVATTAPADRIAPPPGCHVWCRPGRLDGPGGTMAIMQRPVGLPTEADRLEGVFDLADHAHPWWRWIAPLYHELLHALGLGHAPIGSSSLMAPALDLAAIDPSKAVWVDPWEVEGLRLRYPGVIRP